MIANGLARASSAIAIESKPIATNTPGLRNPVVPVISLAPARPANAPESAITSTIDAVRR